ncbi:hypothetical protein RRG08_056485 [Elysia crispata]|uniref:Uncharacterized protein n=1 Tax=Elysia crispata TaxID=231223 RepID=A0AAE1CKX0_9GAST|nr:hypothetical protein RRG08_056485 [Elysia crispata]
MPRSIQPNHRTNPSALVDQSVVSRKQRLFSVPPMDPPATQRARQVQLETNKPAGTAAGISGDSIKHNMIKIKNSLEKAFRRLELASSMT